MVRTILWLFLVFTVYDSFAQQPIINSFSPTSGNAGVTVTISGSNFNTIPSNNVVFFGAVKANVISSSATSLSVTAPLGATYQPITVTTGGLTGYSSAPFIQTFAGGVAITNNSFAPKFDSTTDLHPNGLAVADYDGDGKSDIATANNYSTVGFPASVSILRNTGSVAAISFAPAFNLTTGVLTYAIAAGDLDGDGKPDLVSSSIVDKTISVFKNTSTTGNISFAAKIDFATGDNPFSIGINDIDRDGKPDIVVVNYLSQSVSVFRNTGSIGNISFASKVDFATSAGPRCLAIGDLDGDGMPDLAIANEFTNTVSGFRNTSTVGNISFAARIDFTAGSKPFGLAIGDLDGDGKADLAVSNNNSTNCSVLRNTSTTGSIAFAVKIDFTCTANQNLISIGDLNGDGKPDLVVAGANLTLLQNLSTTSNISFSTPWALSLSPVAFAVALADLDVDGKADLTGAIFTSNKVSIFRNRNNEPVILSFAPTAAGTGATVTITGMNFTGTTAVKFGGIPASSFSVINNTTITAVVSTGVSGDVTVTNPYGIGKLAGYIFAGPPIISSFTPTTTGQGQTVTITGSNFTGATAVSFGGVPATSFTIVSPNTISAIVGTGASGNVSVTTPYGTGILGGFVFVPFPIITSFTPTSAPTGTSISITGLNFSGATAVSFGGVPASTFTVNSGTSITAVVANGASGNVNVTTSFGTASLSGFSFIPPPLVSSFSPTSGYTGIPVTITGSNFTGVTAVSFGGTQANSFSVISSTTINAIVGPGATGNLVVTGPGGVSTQAGFTFIPPVKINSITPDYGPAASNFTITGSGFQTTPSLNNVTVGSIAATIVTATPTTLTVLSPVVATNKPVNVLVNNLLATSILPYRTAYTTSDTAFSAGSFSAPLRVTGGADTKSLISADIDNDGKLDILATNINTKKIAILRNTSNSNAISYAPKVEIDDFWISYKLAAADLDGDGKIDLVSGNQSNSNRFSVFRNTSTLGNISFANRIEFAVKNCVALPIVLTDVDGDGRVDVVARPISTGLDSIMVFRNKSTIGVINFDSPQPFYIGVNGSSLHDLLADDLDGDGKPDLIVNTPTLSCLRNTSTPGMVSFSPVIYSTGVGNTQYLVIADVDGNGKKDIAAMAGGIVTIYNNQSVPGNLSFTTNPIATPSGIIRNLSMGDLDGDGKPEIITLRGSLNQFSIYKNKSGVNSVTFAPKFDYAGASAAQFSMVDLSDMDGDSKMDVVIAAGSFSDSIFVFRNSLSNALIQLCTTGNYSITSNITGVAYQWQQNTGSGFSNINNSANFSGTNSITLQLTNIPLAWSGYQYRCLIDNINNSLITTINVNISPVAVAGNDTSICSGSSVQLNGSGGITYSWSPTLGLSNPNIANPLASPTATTAYILTAYNSSACFSNDTIIITVNQPLQPIVIISTPVTTICSGSSITFTAISTNGGSSPFYQWQVNGINAGTNSNIFTTATLNNGDQVRCMLTSNETCLLNPIDTSNVISVTVNASSVLFVSISTPSSTICAGTPITFTAVPTNGGASPFYQWQVNGINSGSNSNIFTTSSLNNGDQVRCILTSNAACLINPIDTSNLISITVNTSSVLSVSISTPNATICAGTPITFTAVPTNGGASPFYQWQLNGINAGTNSNIFTIATLNNGDQVRCILSSNEACIINPTDTSNVISITVNTSSVLSVSISTPNATICAGTPITFTAVPTNGGASPVYQWQVNGINSGANSNIFTTATLNNGDQVRCILSSNESCLINPTDTSNVISITVNASSVLSVSINTPITTICAGTLITFTAVPTNGGANPVYQWQVNGINSGTNSNIFTTSSLNNGDQVRCILTSNAACLINPIDTSNAISITVNASSVLSVSISTPSSTICAGTPITFTAIPVNGGTSPGYQWQVNGINSGTNSNIFTTATLNNGDQVRCILSSNEPCLLNLTDTSNVISITVNASSVLSVSISTPSSTICAGTPITFTAIPTNGGTNPFYQWQVNDMNTGTNSDTFTTSTLTNNAQVKVILTSSLACASPTTATSSIINMTVVPLPIANAGNDVSICAGFSTQLLATGGTTYSWSPVTGLSNPNIANPVASPFSTTTFTVTVSNGINCSSQDSLVVNVDQLLTPGVSINATNNNICLGTIATFTAVPTNGGSNPAYQWQVNGINAGANSNIFASSALTNVSQVKVILTSNSVCLTTPTATSNIIPVNVTELATPLISLNSSLLTITNPDLFAMYTWQIKNGNGSWSDVVPIATGILYTALTAGEYRVMAIKGNCIQHSVSELVNFNTSDSDFINLYPNPGYDFITLDSITLVKKYETVEIIDMQGKRVLPLLNVLNRTSVTVDVRILRKGMYIAILRKRDGTHNALKFLKE